MINRLFKTALFLAIIPLLLFGCGQAMEETSTDTVVYHSDYPHYETIDEMEEISNLIISGKVVDSTVQVLDVSGQPLTEEELNDEEKNPHPEGKQPNEEPLESVYTVSTIEIDEKFKGEYSEEVIKVKQGGGVYDDVLHVESGVEMFEEGKSYILFLQTYDSIPASLLNPYQAAYVFGDGEIQSFHPDNDLSLNIEKIQQVKEKYASR